MASISTDGIPSASEDFYMHVNKKWLDAPENTIPGEYSSWGGFVKLHDEGLKKQIKLVKALGEKTDRNEEEEKIYAIWKASSDRFSRWAEGGGTYEPLINEFAVLDSFLNGPTFESDEEYTDNLAKYLHYTQMTGIRNVLDFDKGSDLKNVNNVVLDLSTSGLSFPSRDFYFEENFADKREFFKGHLEKVQGLVEANIPDFKLGQNFVESVIEFENELAKYSMKPAQRREYPDYYTNTSLVDVYEKIDELRTVKAKFENYEESEREFKLENSENKAKIGSLMEKMYGLFDFRKIMEANRAKHFGDDASGPDIDHITAYDGDGLRRVLSMVVDHKANFAKYKCYMQYKVIAKFFSFTTKEMDDEFFDFYQRKLGGQQEQKPNEKRSINIVNRYAGEMMGKIFCANFFPAECKKDVENLIDETITIMKESLETNDWLTSSTKVKALEKLQRFRKKIGYPDKWKDYSDFDATMGDSLYQISKKAKKWTLRVDFFEKLNSILDREEWRMTPQTVNAYFMPTQNEIVFPAAILQPPFYHKSSDTVDFDVTKEKEIANGDFDMVNPANFGGIVAVIAHEITHGYDDKGRKFDADGNINDWWTEDDAGLFTKYADIMGKSSEKYTFVDVESEEKKEYKMNPQLTMGENLADLGGLSLSLQALLKRLEAAKASDGVRRASLRVLFKSWANVWKQNTKKERRIMLLTMDPHAPTDFRGNLAQHMDEFYEAFEIKEGDTMWIPKGERVRMW